MRKILILSANPKDTSKLRLDEEVRKIQTALKLAKHRDQFEIVSELAVRVSDLRRALLYHQPTIIHFCGHGSGSTGLVLEDNSGQTQLVSTESLARLFQSFQDSIECVLLNACYSKVQAEAIHQYIDYVVGMSRVIGDAAAIEFAIGFYDALGGGRCYEDCFEIGRASLDLLGIPESETPVLKARWRRQKTQPQNNLESVVSATPFVRNDSMDGKYNVGQNHSVSIGGNVTGSAIQTGDRNVANVQFQPVSLPSPESVDIRSVLNALQEVLSFLKSSEGRKIDNAFADAFEELNKPKPDKNEVGKALDRALDYAKKAEAFTMLIEKLKPHITAATAWLGENWYKLLSIVGSGI